jgi:energy-converting hydrogenase Eha subunit F
MIVSCGGKVSADSSGYDCPNAVRFDSSQPWFMEYLSPILNWIARKPSTHRVSEETAMAGGGLEYSINLYARELHHIAENPIPL